MMRTRRNVLLQSAAALLASIVNAEAQTPLAEVADRCLPPRTPNKALDAIPIVDIHCHVFNGTDLPAATFLDRRISEVASSPGVGKFAIDFLLPGARDTLALAATYDVEKKVLTHLLDPRTRPFRQNKTFFPTTERELRKSLIMGRIRELADGDADKVAAIAASLAAIYFARMDAGGSGDDSGTANNNDTFIALREINKAWLPLPLNSETRPSAEFPTSPRGSGLASDRTLVSASRQSPRRLAWALTRTRTANYQTLRALYGPARRSASTKPHVRLFTPAMVDFEYWYDSAAPARAGTDAANGGVTSPARQVELMGLLMKAYPGEMHPFVSFCPWREADEKLRLKIPEAKRSLGLVKQAAERGFIGVKLYPPAGFRPVRNLNSDKQTDIATPSHYAQTRFPDGKEFGAALDESLQELYALCAAEDIPIMVHTAYSNSGGDDFSQGTTTAEYSHPRYWDTILTQHPRLRLNFAHMGLRMRGWLQNVGVMMDKYANVYADIGYFEQVLYDKQCRPADCTFKTVLADTFLQAREGNDRFYREPGENLAETSPDLERMQCSKSIAGLEDKYDLKFVQGTATPGASSNRWRRIMYGSDWSMVGVQAESANYLDVVASRYLAAVGDIKKAEAFLSSNALVYLGLVDPAGATTKQRGRLEAHYRDKTHGFGWSEDRTKQHFAKFEAIVRRTHSAG